MFSFLHYNNNVNLSYERLTFVVIPVVASILILFSYDIFYLSLLGGIIGLLESQ